MIGANTVPFFLNEVRAVVHANSLPHLHEGQTDSSGNTVPVLNEVWYVISANILPQLHEGRALDEG